jgi:hypothetical protein
VRLRVDAPIGVYVPRYVMLSVDSGATPASVARA